MQKLKVLSVFGTRPEAIKMAPVIMKLQQQSDLFISIICVTAQHREMLDQVLELFNIKPDIDLDIMKHNQDLWSLTSDVLLKMKDIYQNINPDIVLVHGDTTTTFAASLSAFYSKTPIGHVEAGLRTFNRYYPFPEEINRVITDALSSFYFAPTDRAVENLQKSGITNGIHKTGNTVIDALIHTVDNHAYNLAQLGLNPGLKTILLTSHRRENFGEPLHNICKAVKVLVEQNKDIQVVYPVHKNPNVQSTVYSELNNTDRVLLIDPLNYVPFVNLMKSSYIILTDSGGVQEEAPSLGKPVLVLRDTTERPEAIESGTVKLAGSNTDKIVKNTQLLLDSDYEYEKMAKAVNPYGDGLAAERIVNVLKEQLLIPLY